MRGENRRYFLGVGLLLGLLVGVFLFQRETKPGPDELMHAMMVYLMHAEKGFLALSEEEKRHFSQDERLLARFAPEIKAHIDSGNSSLLPLMELYEKVCYRLGYSAENDSNRP